MDDLASSLCVQYEMHTSDLCVWRIGLTQSATSERRSGHVHKTLVIPSHYWICKMLKSGSISVVIGDYFVVFFMSVYMQEKWNIWASSQDPNRRSTSEKDSKLKKKTTVWYSYQNIFSYLQITDGINGVAILGSIMSTEPGFHLEWFHWISWFVTQSSKVQLGKGGITQNRSVWNVSSTCRANTSEWTLGWNPTLHLSPLTTQSQVLSINSFRKWTMAWRFQKDFKLYSYTSSCHFSWATD